MSMAALLSDGACASLKWGATTVFFSGVVDVKCLYQKKQTHSNQHKPAKLIKSIKTNNNVMKMED